MPSRFCPAFVLLVAFVMTSPVRVSAEFWIRGSMPKAMEGTQLEVLRESLETRRQTPVANYTVDGDRINWSIEAEPGLYLLQGNEQTVSFVAKAGDVLELKVGSGGAEASWDISGTADQAALVAYDRFRRASLARTVYPARAALKKHRSEGDASAIEALTLEEVRAYDRHRSELNDFTLAVLPDTVALYASSLRWKSDYRLEDLRAAVEAFAKAHPHWEIGRLMQERLTRMEQTQIGAEAPDLVGKNPDGEPVALRDYRGKVVLVDFWASWCPPCRIANREYVRLYEQFHDAGFEILAVSVDRNASAWKRAIIRDQATWVHLGDLVGWGSPLAERYNVSALPANFLLDAEGRILARDVEGEALAGLLQRHLSE